MQPAVSDSYPWTARCMRRCLSAIPLATGWPEFIEADWKRIKETMVEPYAIFDGRNALPKDKLIAIGFQYMGIGRVTGQEYTAA